MKLTVNHHTHEIREGRQRILLWVLRDELGLPCDEEGCMAGQCGKCTVLVDGVATRACLTSVGEVEGKEILTYEALQAQPHLQALRDCFAAEQVLQCGWCAVGQMMAAAALLQAHPHPSDDEIIDAMSPNYCRCAAYSRIRRAVRRAAGDQEEMEELEPVA